MKNKKQIRQQFRDQVFTRDKFICRVCGEKRYESDLDAHHITDRHHFKNGGYVVSNGITVCKDECHMKVEKYHISNGKEWEKGFHPDDLYKLIGSSLEKAKKDDLMLK
jgi:5-methylcytosine-specific restriction endonuclease McrA